MYAIASKRYRRKGMYLYYGQLASTLGASHTRTALRSFSLPQHPSLKTFPTRRVLHFGRAFQCVIGCERGIPYRPRPTTVLFGRRIAVQISIQLGIRKRCLYGSTQMNGWTRTRPSSDNCKVHVALPKFWAGTSCLFGWLCVLGFYGVHRLGREAVVITGECYFAFTEGSLSG